MAVSFVWVLFPALLQFAENAGHLIAQDDMGADYLVAWVWATVLGSALLIAPIRFNDKRILLWGWLVRVAVVLLLMLPYENHYGLDAYGYFQSRLIQPDPRYLGFGLGSENMQAIAWLHQQVLPDSYHAMKLTCAMIGLIAVFMFCQAARTFVPSNGYPFSWFLLLDPSITFWSSILGKDPISLLGVGLYTYGVAKFCTYGVAKWSATRRTSSLVFVIIGILIASLIRFWFAVILGVPLLVLFFRLAKSLSARIVLVVLIIAGVPVLDRVANSFHVSSTYTLIAQTRSLASGFHQGGSAIEPVPQVTGMRSFVVRSPWAVFTALFRPAPGEVNNVFGILAGLEDLCMLLLVLRAAARTRLGDLKEPPVLWGTAVILCWAMPNGFVTSQNVGSAVRYRLQILPILLGLLLYLGRYRRSIARPSGATSLFATSSRSRRISVSQ